MAKTFKKRVTLIVFLIASCNLVWQFYRIQREAAESQRAYEQSGVIACRFGPSRDEISRLYVEVFLLMALIGGRLKGFARTLFSVIGLAGVLVIYVLWWQYLFRVAANAEVMDLKLLPHFAYLWGGNVLDVAIAISTALLVVLSVLEAVNSLFRPTRAWSGLAGE